MMPHPFKGQNRLKPSKPHSSDVEVGVDGVGAVTGVDGDGTLTGVDGDGAITGVDGDGATTGVGALTGVGAVGTTTGLRIGAATGAFFGKLGDALGRSVCCISTMK